jgi:hypothetical protein
MLASFCDRDVQQNRKGVLVNKLVWLKLERFILFLPMAQCSGMAGLFKILKQKEKLNHWGYHYLSLFAISVFFIFFVINPTELHFGLLKATRIISICLLVFSAYYFENIRGTQKLSRFIMILMLMGVPSLFTDNLRRYFQSFYLRSVSDMGCRMDKKNLQRAIIQAEPNYPGTENGKYPK